MLQVLDQTRSHVHHELVELDCALCSSFCIFKFEGSPCKHLNVTSRRFNVPIEGMLTAILVIVDRNAQGKLLVVVTELSHEELVRLPPRICNVISVGRLKDLHEIT